MTPGTRVAGTVAALGLGLLLMALPLLLALLPVFLIGGLVVGLVGWVKTEAPQVPPPLEAIYRQAQGDTGVPWAALAAWDGAENGFSLPVDPVEVIFNRLYQEALSRKIQAWREWCQAHRDPETGREPSPECDSPPEMTEEEVQQLHKQAVRINTQLIRQYIYDHAAVLRGRIEFFATNPELAYNGLVPPARVALANDLYEGYSLVQWYDEDHADNHDVPVAAEPPPGFIPAPGFAWPCLGPITSRFGPRVSPIDGQPRFHAGIDLGVPAGTAVHASKAGTVAAADFDEVYGWKVILDHGDGYTTLYAHNTRLQVSPGQRVQQGDVLALSGSSGMSTGPHVHFEIHLHGTAYDPLLFLGRT